MQKLIVCIFAIFVLTGCIKDREIWDDNGKLDEAGEDREVWDRNGEMDSDDRKVWEGSDGEPVVK